ncbi:hypothetical protein D7Y57_17075 [Stenotrophomonas maltophilia]|nr:hypothetical protein [Stenotrophomonas maltophilia]
MAGGFEIKGATLKRSSVTHFFCPPTARMECASDSTWGAHRLRVEVPSPLAGIKPPDSELLRPEFCSSGNLRWVELLSHRFNSQADGGGLLEKMSNPGRLRIADILAPAALTGVAARYFELARALGCRGERRSSFCWLGNSGPVGSQCVFGPAERIPEQLADLQQFIDESGGYFSAWRAEAIAYQLFMIHPLSDGNGRAIRAVMIGFHRRFGSVEALYIFWRLKFGKRVMFDQWKLARLAGVNDSLEDSFIDWCEKAVLLNEGFDRLIRSGMARQAVVALCLHGEVSEASVRACDGGLGRATARRIVDGWNVWIERDQGGAFAALGEIISSMKSSVNSRECEIDDCIE